MPNININIEEFQCTPTILNSATYTGTEYIIRVSYNSISNYYSQFYPNIRMSITLEIFDVDNNSTIFTGEIDANAPLNTTSYDIQLNTYGFIFKHRVTVTGTFLGFDGCRQSFSHIFPPNSLI